MTIQSDVYTIILLTILLGIAIVVVGKKIEKLNPLEKPTGIAGAAILGVQSVYNTARTNTGKKVTLRLAPYVVVLWVYIFIANISSLFGLSSPTANYSVTLLLALITWILIQATELKYGGLKGYLHSFLEPLAVMLPMNIIGKFGTLISMSFRLFGNITAGTIMMQLVYSACQTASNALAGLFTTVDGNVFNFLGPIVAPLLHAYFDVFSGFIQTLVFVTLTVVLIGNDIPEEYKD